jgi:hypothetical protein
MPTLAALRADHALLRKKLALLESSLQIGPEARLMLRELSFSLLRLLQAHVQREAGAVDAYCHQVPSGRYLLRTVDHSVEQRLLRTVHEWLLSGLHVPTPMIILRLSQAAEQLTAQMEAQERTVFPVLGDLEEAGASDAAVPEAIRSSMSVNEVLRRYPQTQPVFEQFHVNRLCDGCDSVDEVAWRHGVELTELLTQLQQAVTFSSR